jgi:hypothetical protein
LPPYTLSRDTTTSLALHLSPVIRLHASSSDPCPWCVRFFGIQCISCSANSILGVALG